MSKADCYQGKAGRCAQVCEYLGWMPPTNTCQTQCTHHITCWAWLLPQVIFCSFDKGGFLRHSGLASPRQPGRGWVAIFHRLLLPKSTLTNGLWLGWPLWQLPWELLRANQVVLVLKNPPANAGGTRDVVFILWSGRSPGAAHLGESQYSCLENPMDTGAWRATVHGVELTAGTKLACMQGLSATCW